MKEEVQKYILAILTELKRKIPTDAHCLKLGEDGRLWLWIDINGLYQSIIFDENYEDVCPEKVVEDIIISLKEAGYQLVRG